MQLLWCTATLDNFYAMYLILTANKENGSEMTFVADATKINFKNLKTYLWLDDVYRKQSEDINYKEVWHFGKKFWQKFYLSL